VSRRDYLIRRRADGSYELYCYVDTPANTFLARKASLYERERAGGGHGDTIRCAQAESLPRLLEREGEWLGEKPPVSKGDECAIERMQSWASMLEREAFTAERNGLNDAASHHRYAAEQIHAILRELLEG